MSNSPNGSNHSSAGRENPTGHSNSTLIKRRNSRESPKAFYEIPPWVENVPSKIINEAKQSLRDMPTSRPYTPRDDMRYTLTKLNRDTTSFNSLSVDYETESRPTSSKPAELKRQTSKDSIAGINDKSPIVVNTPVRLSKLSHQPSEDQSDSIDSNQSKPPLPIPSQQRSTTTKSSHHRLNSTSSKDESSEENLIWKHEISPLIETLITAYQKNHFDQYDRTCNDLYDILSKHNLFTKKTNKKRGEFLKTLFTFIESDNSIVRYHVARLSLAFQVSSTNNLKNIIRLIADLSSNKENDHLFLNTNLLDLLFETIYRIEIEQNLESIEYFSTTLKNLTVNNQLICFISEKQPFQLLKNLLKSLLHLKDQTNSQDHLRKCLIPLTETLRNLAENDLNRHEYLADDLINHLTFILKYFTDKIHADLMMNIARLFSKLTQHTNFCLKLVQYSSIYRSFLKILIKHESNQALVVRICFILGNLMAKSEDARVIFLKESHSFQTLTKLLHSYIQLDSLILKPDKLDNDESMTNENEFVDDSNLNQYRSIENVINKVIRILSNLAITQDNGLIIIRRDDCIDLLFKILKEPNKHSEELLVHVLMALNNLSYYDDPQSFIIRNAESLTQLLVKYIRNDERMDCVVEAFRVLGNLSRAKKIRDILIKCKIDRLAIDHCRSDNIELLYAVIGVLINLTVDEDKRECLQIHDGINSLINIFEYSIHSDWQLASLVCKALWNYCDKASNKILWFNHEQLKVLFSIFDETLHEENLELDDNDDQLNELNKQFWSEEYFPVASRLYQRLVQENN